MLEKMRELAKKNLTESDARKIYEWKLRFTGSPAEQLEAYEVFRAAFNAYPALYNEYFAPPKTRCVQYEDKVLDIVAHENDLGMTIEAFSRKYNKG